MMAVAARDAFHMLGPPEGYLPLAEMTIYLATAPKSNSAKVALGAALDAARDTPAAPVPIHIRNAPTGLMKELGYGKGYRYAHDSPEAYLPQEYLPDELRGTVLYQPGPFGYEKKVAERLEWWERRKAEGSGGEGEGEQEGGGGRHPERTRQDDAVCDRPAPAVAAVPIVIFRQDARTAVHLRITRGILAPFSWPVRQPAGLLPGSRSQAAARRRPRRGAHRRDDGSDRERVQPEQLRPPGHPAAGGARRRGLARRRRRIRQRLPGPEGRHHRGHAAGAVQLDRARRSGSERARLRRAAVQDHGPADGGDAVRRPQDPVHSRGPRAAHPRGRWSPHPPASDAGQEPSSGH